MAEDDTSLVGADRPSEDVVATAVVALVVGPLGELLGLRRMTEAPRALAHDEPEHDAQRLARFGHSGGLLPRLARGRQARRRRCDAGGTLDWHDGGGH